MVFSMLVIFFLFIFFVCLVGQFVFLKTYIFFRNQNDDLVQNIIDAIPHPIFLKNVDARFVKVNIAYLDVFGVKKRDVLGRSIYHIGCLPLDKRHEYYDEDRSVVYCNKSFKDERTIEYADGSLHRVLYYKKLFKGMRAASSGIVGCFVDVTELDKARRFAKKVQQEISSEVALNKAILSKSNRYLATIQSMHQAVMWVDQDGNILEINDEFTKIYGYIASEVVGKNPKILNPGIDEYINCGFTRDEYVNLFKKMWEDVLNPEIATWEGNVINKKKGGALVWVNLKISTCFNADGSVSSIIGLLHDITARRKKNEDERIQAFRAIAELAELRDYETGAHMKRVGIFSRILAKSLGMSRKFCDDILIFAPLHDIGKVGILDSILLAPRKLSEDELKIMKTHTILGYNIVKDKVRFEMAADIILSHHERFDGNGYPNGLIGDDIPLAAQIVSVVDVYDALRSKRPYKKGCSHAEALNVICSSKEKQFSKKIVDAFIAIENKICRIYDEVN